MSSSKMYAVIGLGRFGTSIAVSLAEKGYEVLAVDINPNLIKDIADKVTHAVCANGADESALRALSIKNFDTVVVTTASDIKASVMAVLLCKELGVKRVIAKAYDETHSKMLYKVGADQVLLPERDMGERVAMQLTSTNILDYIQLSDAYSVAEIHPPSSWRGEKLEDINARSKYKVVVMAIRRGSEDIIAPSNYEKIGNNDIILVLGSNESIKNLSK